MLPVVPPLPPVAQFVATQNPDTFAKPNLSALGSELRHFNKKKGLKCVPQSELPECVEKVEMSAFASYDIGTAEDRIEYHDSEDVINEKVKSLAELIRHCNYMVVYTGAGISTSAGISDFRSPEGLWTLKAEGKKCPKGKSLVDLVPTPAHMALRKLCDEDICKCIVTTNGDGLHHRSGASPKKVCDLHGNDFKLYCCTCQRDWFYFPEQMHIDPNYTKIGRGRCPKCGSSTRTTGVAFGRDLPEAEYKMAKEHSQKSDLALVLGTSMRVSPACNLPEHSYHNKGHLIICNLQKTPYDKYAKIVIHAPTDVVMTKLMEELGLPIPEGPGDFWVNEI